MYLIGWYQAGMCEFIISVKNTSVVFRTAVKCVFRNTHYICTKHVLIFSTSGIWHYWNQPCVYSRLYTALYPSMGDSKQLPQQDFRTTENFLLCPSVALPGWWYCYWSAIEVSTSDNLILGFCLPFDTCCPGLLVAWAWGVNHWLPKSLHWGRSRAQQAGFWFIRARQWISHTAELPRFRIILVCWLWPSVQPTSRLLVTIDINRTHQ